MSGFCVIFLISICLLKITSSATNDLNYIDEDLSKHSLYYGMVSMSMNTSQDTECLKELATVSRGILNGNRWAIKMLDASGTPGTGLYWGNNFWLGNRKQCEGLMVIRKFPLSPLGGQVTIENQEGVPPFSVSYYGAYFFHDSVYQIRLQMKDELKFKLGLCLPSSCKESEVHKILKDFFDTDVFQPKKIYNMTLKMQTVKKVHEDPTWLKNSSTIALGCISFIIIILCILGTIYDAMLGQPATKILKDINMNDLSSDIVEEAQLIKSKFGHKLLLCFSVFRNNKSIFNTEDGSDTVKCINGLRILFQAHIIIGHIGVYQGEFINNMGYLLTQSDAYMSQLIAHINLAVDAFYCISGYLLTYSFYTNKRNFNGSENKLKLLFKNTIKRYERILPSFLFCMLLFHVLSSWRANSIFQHNEMNNLTCETYWWRNLLFTGTLYPQSQMCMSWSWYLNNDMLFFVIITFLLILSKTHFKRAVFIITLLSISSFVYYIYLIYIYEYIPFPSRLGNLLDIVYLPPWIRINSYIVGVISGYTVYKLNNTLPLKKSIIQGIWFLYVCITLIILFGFGDFTMSLSASMVYVPTVKIIFSLTISWILIACQTGNGGFFNRFLCSKFWIPLSHINYWAFLIHPIVMIILPTIAERPLDFDNYSVIMAFPSLFIYTFLFAYIFTITVELPIANVLKTIKINNKTHVQ